jgi:hypothetical protein
MPPCRRQLALCRPDDDIVQVQVLAIGAPSIDRFQYSLTLQETLETDGYIKCAVKVSGG